MTLRRLTILLASAALAAYIGLQIRGLRLAPPLELYSPVPGLTTADSVVELSGKTAPGALLEVNGAVLTPSRFGQFSRKMVLNRGLNTIVVTARRRYSKMATVERQVFILEGNRLSKGPEGDI